MHTTFFYPALSSISGGMRVIAQLAVHLHGAGHSVSLMPTEPCSHLEELAPSVPVCSRADFALRSHAPEDVCVVPEGWPMGLSLAFKAGLRCVVYVQNWAYCLSHLPPDLRLGTLPVTFLSVSDPVAYYVRAVTGVPSRVLRPGIDLVRYTVPQQETRLAPVGDGTVRIAWMPRKNKALAVVIREMVHARLSPRDAARLEWVEIHGCTPDEVAQRLRASHLFLATGFPEGFGLPPLEAMASGCCVVGFGGFGGFDYMRQALPEACGGPNGEPTFVPWWPLRDVPWGGNGFFVSDADMVAAGFALERAVQMVRAGGAERTRIYENGLRTVKDYSLECQRETVCRLWDEGV